MTIYMFISWLLISSLGLICLWQITDLWKKKVISSHDFWGMVLLGPLSWSMQIYIIYLLVFTPKLAVFLFSVTIIAFALFMVIQAWVEEQKISRGSFTTATLFGEIFFPIVLIGLLPEGYMTIAKHLIPRLQHLLK